MADRVEAGTVDDLEPGELKSVEAGGRTVVLLNVDDVFYAIDDECTHQGCSLSDGDLDGELLGCICHGSMFNVKTGEVVEGPAEDPVSVYPVEVDGSDVFVVESQGA